MSAECVSAGCAACTGPMALTALAAMCSVVCVLHFAQAAKSEAEARRGAEVKAAEALCAVRKEVGLMRKAALRAAREAGRRHGRVLSQLDAVARRAAEAGQRPAKSYDIALRALEAEQGDWYVSMLLNTELSKLYKHYSRAAGRRLQAPAGPDAAAGDEDLLGCDCDDDCDDDCDCECHDGDIVAVVECDCGDDCGDDCGCECHDADAESVFACDCDDECADDCGCECHDEGVDVVLECDCDDACAGDCGCECHADADTELVLECDCDDECAGDCDCECHAGADAEPTLECDCDACADDCDCECHTGDGIALECDCADGCGDKCGCVCHNEAVAARSARRVRTPSRTRAQSSADLDGRPKNAANDGPAVGAVAHADSHGARRRSVSRKRAPERRMASRKRGPSFEQQRRGHH